MCVRFSLDRQVFSVDVVARTAYRYRGVAAIEVRAGESEIEVVLTPLASHSEALEAKFRADLWDDRLREQIAAQTQSLQQELVRVALQQALASPP